MSADSSATVLITLQADDQATQATQQFSAQLANLGQIGDQVNQLIAQLNPQFSQFSSTLDQSAQTTAKTASGFEQNSIAVEKFQQAQNQTAISAEKLQQAQNNTATSSQKLQQAQTTTATATEKLQQAQNTTATTGEKLRQSQIQTAEAAAKLSQAQTNAAAAALKLEQAQQKANQSHQEGEGFANQFAGALFKIPEPAELAAEAVKKIGEMALEALETSIEEAAKFDQQLTNLAAAAGIDRTSKAFDDLGNAALEVGKLTKYSSDVAIQGFQELRNKGLEVQDIIGVSLPAAYLAEMQGAQNMTEASKTLASTLNAFKLSAQDAQHMADEQAKAFQQTGLTTKDFGDAIKNAAAIAQSTKQSFESMTAALEAQKTAGIDGARASVNYRQVISSLIKPNQQAADTISNLGLQLRGADGNLKDYADIVTEVTTKTANLDPASKQLALTTIFGKQGFIAMTDAMNASVKVHDELGDRVLKGADAIRYYEKSLKDADGTTEEMANTMRQSLEMQFQTLMGSVKELSVQFGKMFLPGLAVVTEGAGKLVNDLITKLEPIEKDLTPKITEAFQVLWDTIHPIFEGIINGASQAYDTLKPSIDEIFKILEDNKGTLEQIGKQWGEELPAEINAFVVASKPVIDTLIHILDLLAKIAPVVEAVANPLGFLINKWDELNGKGKEIPPTVDQINKSLEDSQKSLAATSAKVEELTQKHDEAQKKFEDLAKSGTASSAQLEDAQKQLIAATSALGAAQAEAKSETDKFNDGLKDLEDRAKTVKDKLAEMDKQLKEKKPIDTTAYAQLTAEEQKLTASIKKEKDAQAKAGKDAAKQISGAAEQSDDQQAASEELLTKKKKDALQKIEEAQQTHEEKTKELAQKTADTLKSLEDKHVQDLEAAQQRWIDAMDKNQSDRVKTEQSTIDKIKGIEDSLADKEMSIADQVKTAEANAQAERLKLQNEFKDKTFKNADERKAAERKLADDLSLIDLKLKNDKDHLSREEVMEQTKAARDKVAANQKAGQDLAAIADKEAKDKAKAQSDIEKINQKAKADSDKTVADQKAAQLKLDQSLDTTVTKYQADAKGINDAQKQTSDGATKSADGVDTANQKMADSTATTAGKVTASHSQISASAAAMSDAVIKSLQAAIDKMDGALSAQLTKLDQDLNTGFQKMIATVNADSQKMVDATNKVADAVKASASTIVTGVSDAIEHSNSAILKNLESFEKKEDDILNKLVDKVKETKQKVKDAGGGDDGDSDSASSAGAQVSEGSVPLPSSFLPPGAVAGNPLFSGYRPATAPLPGTGGGNPPSSTQPQQPLTQTIPIQQPGTGDKSNTKPVNITLNWNGRKVAQLSADESSQELKRTLGSDMFL